MSYIIPMYAISNKFREYRKSTCDLLERRLVEFGFVGGRHEVRITNLSYKNLGLTSWQLPALSEKPTIWIRTEVPYNMIYAITTVIILSANPMAATLEFKAGFTGNSIRGVFPLDELKVILPLVDRAEGNKKFQRLLLKRAWKLCMVGFLSDPIFYDPQEFINISATAEADTLQAGRIAIGGFIASPRGTFID